MLSGSNMFYPEYFGVLKSVWQAYQTSHGVVIDAEVRIGPNGTIEMSSVRDLVLKIALKA